MRFDCYGGKDFEIMTLNYLKSIEWLTSTLSTIQNYFYGNFVILELEGPIMLLLFCFN